MPSTANLNFRELHDSVDYVLQFYITDQTTEQEFYDIVSFNKIVDYYHGHHMAKECLFTRMSLAWAHKKQGILNRKLFEKTLAAAQ